MKEDKGGNIKTSYITCIHYNMMYNVLILNINIQQSVLGQLDIDTLQNEVELLTYAMYKN